MNNTPTPRTDERKASFALDTIRQLESELAAVTEQRDRLAEALKDALYDLETSDGLMACDNEEGHSLFCLEQRSIPKARQALQSLNQNAGGMASGSAVPDSESTNELDR